MFRSIFARQNAPILAGLAFGGAAAMYFSRSAMPLRAEAPGALDPEQFVPIPLESAKWISKDTKELVFGLPDDHTLGGKTAFMVLVKGVVDGKNVIRPYTPVSTPETVGSATFVIKTYEKGKMSQHIAALKTGDTIEVKGPIQKYLIKPNLHKKIGLIGGGTGITPLFQILQTIANNPEDKTQVDLYFGNKDPSEVLIKKEIDELIAKKPDQLKAYYFVDKPDDSWKGEKGFISKEFLESHLFKPSEDNVKVFVCGPPGLYKAISGEKTSPTDQGELVGVLKDLGFNKDQVFKF